MNLKKCKKIMVCVFTVSVLILYFNNIYADINTTYYEKSVSGMLVVDAQIDNKVSGSSLLSALAHLIYTIGSLCEWLLGKMFYLMSGTNIFPWADAIVFNAIPFLDVNFINPTSVGDSVVGMVKGFLQNTYSIIFGISISFFSLAVMVMAVKLVITTIAEEKSKYKQAITEWLIGLVLLFTIHFLMSFIFYLNESLVEVASNIVIPALEEAEDKIKELNEVSSDESKRLVQNFIDAMEDMHITDILSIGLGRLLNYYDMLYLGNNYDRAKEYILEHSEVAVSLLQNERIYKLAFW